MSNKKNTNGTSPAADASSEISAGAVAKSSGIQASPSPTEEFSLSSALTGAGGAGQGTRVIIQQDSKPPHTYYHVTTWDAGEVLKLRQNLTLAKARGISASKITEQRTVHISKTLHDQIELQLSAYGIQDPEDWKSWDEELFFNNINKAYNFGKGEHSTNPLVQFRAGTENLTLDLIPNDPTSWATRYCGVILKLYQDAGGAESSPFTESQLECIIKELVENLHHSKPTSPYAKTVEKFVISSNSSLKISRQ